MKLQGLWQWFLLFAVLFFVSSCSGSSSSDGGIVESESIYDPGASVGAVSYEQAYDIEVLVLNENEAFIPVDDGDFIEPGARTLGVHVEGDPENIDRVFLSNGGVYQVEAQKNGDLYVGQFNVSQESLYQNVLVQVIHNSGRASKEKIVFKTFQHHVDSQYIKNGVGLLVAQEILDGQRNALAESLDDILKDVFAYLEEQSPGFISSIGYGDSNPDTIDVEIATFESVSTENYPRAVLRLSLVVKDVDLYALPLYGQNLVSTVNNDLFIQFFFSIDDKGGDGSVRLVLDLSDPVQMTFEQDFFMRNVVIDMLRDQLGLIDLAPLTRDLSVLYDELIADLPENILINEKAVDLDVLFNGLVMDLNKYLFADIYGVPENTSADVLALGMGLYVEDYEDIVWESYDTPSPSSPFDMEEVFEEICEDIVDEAFEDIRQEYGELITELSYGDNDPYTSDFIVNSFALEDTADVDIKNIRINYTIKYVDLSAVSLFDFDLISTENNDLTVASVLTLEHRISGNEYVLVVKINEVSDVIFARYFVGREVIENMIKNDLENMEDAWFAIDDIMQDIDVNIDISSGLFAGCELPLFPDVTPYTGTPAWELVLSDPYNVACAVSQNNINWVLGEILSRDFEWNINDLLVAFLGEDFEGFSDESPENSETIMYLNVPPVMDVRTSQIRVLVNDVVLQYRLDGKPQWEASVDLDIIIELRVEDGTINFYLTQIPENTHFHVMKDNPGNLGIFDHSTLVNDILDGLPEMLGRSSQDPLITLSLEAFAPTVEFKDVSSPISVSAGGGYLYINMATANIDISQADLWEERCE